LQASFGTAWQASGNFSSSKASGDSNSVNQQSGLFAGDGGYHVKADSVDLKGGAIVSTVTKDKNDLTTNRLTFSNIENQSQYDATTVSLSGGTSLGKGKTGDSKAPTPTNNDNWRNATSFSPSLPQHDSDKDSSTTYATLSAGNITLGGKSTTVEQLGIHRDAATANRGVETLPNLQTILDNQKTVADATSTIAAASRTYAQDQIKNAAAEKEAIGKQIAGQLSPEEQAEIKKMSATEKDQYLAQYGAYDAALANEKAVTQQWGMGGDKSRALNAVTTAITGALGGQTDLQVAANTLAPYAANVIGEKFGHGENKNKAAQLASHAILGATLAYLNGGNPAAGGSAAVASEAAADYFANQYNDGKTAINPDTGEFDANLLPENVKSGIRDLTAAIGAVVGGTVGDSASNAQLAGVIGQNAVENNYLTVKQIHAYKTEMQLCKTKQNCDQVIDKFRKIAIKQDEQLVAVCSTSPANCKQYYQFILKDRLAVKEAIGDAGKFIPAFDESVLWSQQNTAEGIVSNTEFAKQLQHRYGLDEQTAKLTASAVMGAITGVKAKQISGGASKDGISQNGYTFKKGIDLDLRGKNYSTKDALNIAFEKTGVPKNEFTVTKWAVDQNGKSFPAEYRVLSGNNRGAEVSVDLGHTSTGTPGAPHVGWQTPGKKNTVGHIFLDNVNVNRSRSKD